ncbi:hypothetical protein PR003_g7818 [Phytophthora rubi]|uniref:Uncharacterized protein n=1 Tax=Phytophthora rubi TaxID=129364 RepID=A0A6A3NFQ7_9STRA|nr:hypothetical protein PR002_g2878 [Phytophthora rubi]KAE9049856.1 hypothetical protein PR001_g2928 [Phytophthora rubi]KAE9345706.1 hypothetical protein PR003_g7818 [Phytophthora rubi]
MELPESSYQLHVAGGDLQEKLALTFPSENRGGCCTLSLSSCDVKTLVKRTSVLLVFHLLNILVTIGGLVGVSLLLTGVLLNLLWAVGLLLVAVAAIPIMLLERIHERGSWVKRLGYVVLVVAYPALYFATWFNIYTAIGPSVLVVGGAIGLALVYLSIWFTQAVVKTDVRLTNFVTFALPASLSVEGPPQSGECAKQFTIKHPAGIGAYLPVLAMTSRMWIIILYFAVLKTIVGALSAAAIFLAVIQPAISLFSCGDGPFFFSNWMMFHENPVVYFIVICFIEVVGAVGIVIVAAVSVQITSRVFGEWKTQQSESENEVEAATA